MRQESLVRLAAAVLAIAMVLAAVGCGGGSGRARGKHAGVTLQIVAGSENEGLEPIIREFAREAGAEIPVKYLGSVDIALALAEGRAMPYDAVWPANTLWLTMGDKQKVIRHDASIMRSPVVFGVRRSVAERLGWTGNAAVRVADILAAAESGRLSFAMTSATQSNSGASAYLGFLHAMAGSPEVLTAEHLADADVRNKVRRLLGSIDRSSGSSGWLKDMFLASYPRFDAMVNYEAMVIEANRELVARGEEPLCAVYPIDGLTIADHPLAYVDKGDAAKKELFLALQQHLLSPPVQARILAEGRRAGLLGIDAGQADPAIFNREWCIDVARVVSPVPMPGETVIAAALELYQTALRKPSLTVYALDFSGSMKGAGERAVKEAMSTLLRTDLARRYLLQASPEDIHVVVPFNSEPLEVWETAGNAPEQLEELLGKVLALQAGGGTDIYAATVAALTAIAGHEDRLATSFPAVILMTDGRSDGDAATLTAEMARRTWGRDIPVFSITFGDADPTQLEKVSELTSGRVFDGKADLVKAFRQAKGYN